MKSITNQLKELFSNPKTDKGIREIVNQVSTLESDYHNLKNIHSNTMESMELLEYQLDQLKKNDQNALVEISKKLTNTFKSAGEDQMLAELQLQRAKVMDHFTIAYLAETGLKPSESKLVQGLDAEGYFEMYFTKHSPIIIPGES